MRKPEWIRSQLAKTNTTAKLLKTRTMKEQVEKLSEYYDVGL